MEDLSELEDSSEESSIELSVADSVDAFKDKYISKGREDVITSLKVVSSIGGDVILSILLKIFEIKPIIEISFDP